MTRERKGRCAGVCRGFSLAQDARQLLLFDIGAGLSRKGGKPPPESLAKLRRCNLAACVKPSYNGQKTVLLTDGAPCYITLANELGIQHEAVNHSRGQFVRPAKQGRKHIQCHTGTIDSVWALLKRFIPKTLSSHSDKLWLYAKAFQWRYVNCNAELARRTAVACRRSTGEAEN